MPGCVGNHRYTARRARGLHAALQHHQLRHARHRGHRAGFELVDAAAQHRAHHDAGVELPGLDHVEPETRTAVELGPRLQPRRGLADQPPRRRRLQRGRLGQRRSGRGGCQFTERHAAPAARMAHGRQRRDALARWHVPAPRGFSHQRGPRRRAGLPHRQPQVLDAGRAAGQHQPDFTRQLGGDVVGGSAHGAVVVGVERRAVNGRGDVGVDPVHRRRFDAQARPVGFQLFGQQHRQAGVDALAHLALGHDDDHRRIGLDADEAVERHLPGGQQRRCAGGQPLARRQHGPAHHEGAGSAQAAEDEGAPFHARGFWPSAPGSHAASASHAETVRFAPRTFAPARA